MKRCDLLGPVWLVTTWIFAVLNLGFVVLRMTAFIEPDWSTVLNAAVAVLLFLRLREHYIRVEFDKMVQRKPKETR